MPICDIVGVRRVDMEQEQIHGFTIYTNHEEPDVDGLMAEKFFLRDQMLKFVGGVVPAPGMVIDFEWGRNKGRIGRIHKLE